MSYYIKSKQFNKFFNINLNKSQMPYIMKPETKMKPPQKHLQYQKIKPKPPPSPSPSQKPKPQKPVSQ
jgi:hypothetical protein